MFVLILLININAKVSMCVCLFVTPLLKTTEEVRMKFGTGKDYGLSP